MFTARFFGVLLVSILIQSGILFVAGTRHSSSSSSPKFPTEKRSPWWTNPIYLPGRTVDDDYDWDHRDVGITTDEEGGEAYFVEWSHYNRTALGYAAHAAPLVVPWTRGRLMKFLTKLNDTAFHLHNMFEESAVGLWCGGPAFLTKLGRSPDTGNCLYEQHHTFRKTPRRVTILPAVKLPEHWPSECYTSRVTVIGEGGKATVSAPRWLPDDFRQSEELLHGDYQRFEFAEVWLTLDNENGKRGSGIGGRKVGLFVMYDGITGELKQVFTMRQTQVPRSCRSATRMKTSGNRVLLDDTQQYLESQGLWPILPSDNAASKSFRQHTIPEFLEQRGWSCREGICIRTESPAGPAFRVEYPRDGPNNGADQTRNDDYYIRPVPSEEEQELYYDIRFPDGMYAFFPKTFHPTYLSENACIELGCVTEHGLRRIMLAGKRSQGGLNACVYEEWGPSSFEK